jgi:hypothetical protein
VVFLLVLLADDASGSTNTNTVGYWRFEQGAWLTDSSGNNHTLTNRGTNGFVTQTALPESGPGSAFPDPVPQNGLANSNATTFGGGGRLTAADNAAFTTSAFTIEAFINATNLNLAYTPFIASQWNSTSSANDRSWGLAVTRTGTNPTSPGQLQMLLSPNGTNSQIIYSGVNLVLTEGRDYYVAATVSLGAAEADRRITFYLKDLTSSGLLLSNTVGHSTTNLFDSTAAFSIGGQGASTGTGASLFHGVIDEVRFSNAVLAESDLLIVPEPSTFALLGLAAAGLAGHVIRRRRR